MLLAEGQACVGWCGKGWVSWSAGEGVKGSLGGFLVDLARNTLRLNTIHSPSSTPTSSLWLALQARVGLSTYRFVWREHRLCWPDLSLSGGRHQNICPPGACHGCAGHVTSKSKSSRLLWASIGFHTAALLLQRERVGASAGRSLPSCPHLSYWTVCAGFPTHGQPLVLKHRLSG